MAETERFNWRLSLYAAIGALVGLLPLTIYSFDFYEILYIVVVVPVVSLILLIIAAVIACYKKRLRSLAVLSMLAVYCTLSWGLFKNSLEIHTFARWLLSSNEYKAEVLAQPAPANGELKHVEWDGWGWGGIDTTAYLVFDPNNTLSSATRSNSPGRLPGIPCEVSSVHRLQSGWYSIVFYTDTSWNDCGLAREH